MPKISPITQKLSQLKTNRTISLLQGDYKSYRHNKIAFAKVAINNLQAAKQANGMTVNNIPLFSKTGLKILKIWFLELFRIKTPEEKTLKKMLNKNK